MSSVTSSQYADLSWPCHERTRIWFAEHSTVKKVILVCTPLLVGGLLAFCTLSLGVPLGASLPISAFVALGTWVGLEAIFDKPRSSLTLLELLERPEHNAQVEDRSTEQFAFVAKTLGPERFREKLQREVLLNETPTLRGVYRAVCLRLLDIDAGDEFYGPLPELKEVFRQQLQKFSCSQLVEGERRSKGLSPLADKDDILFLRKSQIISHEEAKLLNEAYDSSEYYDKLLGNVQWSLANPYGRFIPEPCHQAIFQLKRDELLDQFCKDRDATLASLDERYAQLRLHPLDGF